MEGVFRAQIYKIQFIKVHYNGLLGANDKRFIRTYIFTGKFTIQWWQPSMSSYCHSGTQY